MNIWTQKGAKIKFANAEAGFPSDERSVKEHLVLDEIYTISRIIVCSYRTTVYLEEVPKIGFNSCHFENATPVDTEIATENERHWNAHNGEHKLRSWEYN
jgi:hypothetical protein